jgi:hypothetical protein
MPLLQVLEALVVVGVLLNGVVVIAVVLWLLNIFGLFHSLARVHVGLFLIP